MDLFRNAVMAPSKFETMSVRAESAEMPVQRANNLYSLLRRRGPV